MNKKILTILSVLVIVVFIGYIIIDMSRSESSTEPETRSIIEKIPDAWMISNEISVTDGRLEAVATGASGLIYTGGDSFISCLDNNLKAVWNIKTPSAVTSLAISGDTIFASTRNQILVLNKTGRMLSEWGPFEDSSLITSVSTNGKFVAVADARNKEVFVLDMGGEVKYMIGQNDHEFVIPSPYFDVVLDKENLYTANTGHHRIELRKIDGAIISYFGEAGLAPQNFSGCCAPAHFIVTPDGFVTSEKGLNRIKILNKKGEFVEFVNSENKFVKSVPLDLASADGKTIYGAYPAESKLYVFKRK